MMTVRNDLTSSWEYSFEIVNRDQSAETLIVNETPAQEAGPSHEGASASNPSSDQSTPRIPAEQVNPELARGLQHEASETSPLGGSLTSIGSSLDSQESAGTSPTSNLVMEYGEKLAEARQILSDREKELEAHKKRVEAVLAENKSLTAREQHAQSQVATISVELTQCKSHLQEEQVRFAALLTKNLSLKQREQCAENHIAKISVDLRKSLSHLQEYKGRFEALLTENFSLKEREQFVQGQIAEISVELRESVSHLQEQQGRFEALLTENLSLAEREQRAQEQIAQTLLALRQSESNLQEQQAQFEALLVENRSLREREQRAQDQVAEISVELRQCEAHLQEQQARLNALLTENLSLTERDQRAQGQIAETFLALRQCEARLQQQQARLNALLRENQSLTEREQHAQRQIAQALLALRQCEFNLAETLLEFKEKETQSESLRKELQKLNLRCEKLFEDKVQNAVKTHRLEIDRDLLLEGIRRLDEHNAQLRSRDEELRELLKGLLGQTIPAKDREIERLNTDLRGAEGRAQAERERAQEAERRELAERERAQEAERRELSERDRAQAAERRQLAAEETARIAVDVFESTTQNLRDRLSSSITKVYGKEAVAENDLNQMVSRVDQMATKTIELQATNRNLLFVMGLTTLCWGAWKIKKVIAP